MDINTAIDKRRSTRAFKPDPVPEKLLKEIMQLALRAPSWANTQPWEFVIAAGNKLEEIKREFAASVDKESELDIAGPKGFPEPYAGRIGRLMGTEQKIKGIEREDREGRGWWRRQGLKNYGAPAVIYVLIDRAFYFQEEINAWLLFDCGLVAENIMLLTTARGLGTVVQGQAVQYPEVLRKALDVPASKLFVIGIAVGYPDGEDPINGFRSERESLDKVARWWGFD
ncbi:MAG: nitroreductase [Dehalococcoidia bacterium]|jgi:nitroreductase